MARLLWGLCLAGAVGGVAHAYDSARPQVPVPEHESPWTEANKPDIRTVFLWKFQTSEDRFDAVDELMDTGAFDDLMAQEDDRLADHVAPAGDVAPQVAGGAVVKAGIGRFGGGLLLDGTGTASAKVPLQPLLETDGGLTLDFWFRPDADIADSVTLFAFCDRRGQALLAATLDGDHHVALTVDGTPRLQVPLSSTVDDWHHLAFVLSGSLRMATPALTVDGRTTRAGTPDPWTPIPWLDGVPARLGNELHIGGIPKNTAMGFKGSVDEVRLAKGIKHLYPWHLGTQERVRNPQDLELKAPFFKNSLVLSRFRFDGELKPDTFSGQSWAARTEDARFQPGVQGQALDLSQIGLAGFEIAGNDFLPERNGTIEFWFRPLDWHNFYVGDYTGQDIPYQWLMAFRAPGEANYQASKNLEIVKGRSWRIAHQRRPDGASAMPWTKIHPGTWTHVLITLADNGAQTVYLNGQQQKFHQLGLILRGTAMKQWQEKTGGEAAKDARRWSFVPSPTLIDELSVYGWAMNPEEAWNAYARWLPDAAAQMKPLPLFKVEFDYFAHSWDMKEKLEIRVACLPVGDAKPASADCELRMADGKVLLAVEKQPLDAAGATTFTLNHSLPFGRYTVAVRSRTADGTVLKEENLEYTREKPEWLGNTLGEDRTVPPPWTPITVNERTLRLIGREIELGANGLPSRIETLGRPVLAEPATIRVDNVQLTGQGPTFTETAPDRVAWKTTLAGGGIVADLDAWLEFDGLLYCAVTLTPAADKDATIADLDIDFPMTPAAATQLLANGGGRDFRNSWIAKYVPARPEKGRSANENGDENGGRSEPPRDPLSSTDAGSLQHVWNSLEQPYPSFGRAFEVTNFMPNIWLGNDQAGLYFGAENDQGWTVDGPKPAQEILRTDEAVVFRMNIIREATVIPAAGRRFHFIMLPTPAKPEPADWRQQMLGKVNFAAVDTFSGFDLKTDPTDPLEGDSFRLEPRSWEYAAEAARKCRTKNRPDGLCILYADASWPRLGPAFSDWRHDMWADTGKIAWTPEFEDYAVWAINEFIKRDLIDGVYWDDVSVGSTLLLRGGAYEYAGSPKGRRVGFTMLAQRRVNLRLWRLFQAAGKEPTIWAHMTVCYEVPLFSFCRYLSNLEFVTGVEFPGKRDAMDVWSPDTLRLLGGSAKWGTGYHNLSTLPRTLPDTAVARQWAYPQQRTETGLYLTSDQMGPPDALGQVLVQEKVFDGPVTAYPWWKADQVVAVTAPDDASVRVGVYVAGDRAVVIIANWDREEREVAIGLKPGVLPGLEQGAVWRDLDPGLEPPKAVAASAEELKQVQAGATASDLLDNDDGRLDDATLGDLLEGTTPEGRARQRLKLRVDGSTARVVVRPRDYRVLEAKPRQDNSGDQ